MATGFGEPINVKRSNPEFAPSHVRVFVGPRARIDSTAKKNSERKETTNPSLSTKLVRSPEAPVCDPAPVITNTGINGGFKGLFISTSTTLTRRNSIVDLNFVGGTPSSTASDIVGAVVAAPLASDFCSEA